MRRLVAATLLILIGSTAFGRDLEGKYANSPLKDWFLGLHNKRGVSCCEVSDGHRVEGADWRQEQDGSYSVFIDKKWQHVDPSDVIDGRNEVGYAIVWIYQDHITCFLPGSLL